MLPAQVMCKGQTRHSRLEQRSMHTMTRDKQRCTWRLQAAAYRFCSAWHRHPASRWTVEGTKDTCSVVKHRLALGAPCISPAKQREQQCCDYIQRS